MKTALMVHPSSTYRIELSSSLQEDILGLV